MKTFIDVVAAWAMEKGVACTFQQGQVGSHQSIGAAEKAHDVQAGYMRTLYSVVLEKIGLKISSRHVLFSWLIRYVTFVMNCLHVWTYNLHDAVIELDARLARFCDQVLFQIGKTTMNPPGKGVPCWAMGTCVGFQEAEKGSVCLVLGGYEMSRTIHRLPPSQRWHKKAMEECRGAPWAGVLELMTAHHCSRCAQRQSLSLRAQASSGARSRRDDFEDKQRPTTLHHDHYDTTTYNATRSTTSRSSPITRRT